MLAAGLSIVAWGPKSSLPATVSPVSPSQESALSRRTGTSVITGGSIQPPPRQPFPGGKAPAFDIAGLGAGKVSYHHASRPTVVDFMANWCVECHRAEHAVEAAYRSYGSRVDFLGVDVGDSKSAAAAFVKSQGISFPVGLDPTESVANRYRVLGMPEVFLVDSGGKVERQFFGPTSKSTLDAAVKALLNASGSR